MQCSPPHNAPNAKHLSQGVLSSAAGATVYPLRVHFHYYNWMLEMQPIVQHPAKSQSFPEILTVLSYISTVKLNCSHGLTHPHRSL